MDKALTIGLVQMNSSSVVEDNLAKAGAYIKKAKDKGADIIILPESFALMESYPAQKLKIQETAMEGSIQSWLSEIARELSVWIVAGTIPIRSGESAKPYARCYLYNRQGQAVCYYDKIHLFDVTVSKGESYKESTNTTPGQKEQVFDIEGVKVGFSVCYDLRFPELYRRYQEQSVELIVAPSAFTENTGKAHWDLLIKARALENLAFVAAPNQTGLHDNNRRTFGHSLIVDPWARQVDTLTTKEDVLVSQLNFSMINSIKEKFPVHEHRVLK